MSGISADNGIRGDMGRMMAVCVVGIVVLLGVTAIARADKLDYGKHKVVVTDVTGRADGVAGDDAGWLVDGIGVGAYPFADAVWVRYEAPTANAPAVLVFDYGTPVKVAALAHYFYVPGTRDQRWQDWLAGPSAFRDVKILRSDDGKKWEEAAQLTDLPTGCPQLLRIDRPVAARYLRLEILSMAPGSGPLRTYEIETYVDRAPKSVSAPGRIVRRLFPEKFALAPANAAQRGSIQLDTASAQISFSLPATGLTAPATGKLDIRVNDQPVTWTSTRSGKSSGFVASVAGSELDLEASFVKAGLLLKFTWQGPTAYPAPKLDVIACPDSSAKEWCVPEYFYSNADAPVGAVGIPAATVPTAIAIVGDGKTTLTVSPDTDRSWVGVNAKGAYATFPLGSENPQVLVLASSGGWFSGFEHAVVDVFNFDEPRQFSPVSQAIPQLCNFLNQPPLWSEKHQMIRSFPDADFFYIFYSLPYAIPALTYWEELSDDASVSRKIDSIISFTLDRRIPSGPMKGALFSEYADGDMVEKGEVPYIDPAHYAWHVKYPGEPLVGMDQGANRWITAHNMGAVLWSITQVWRSRGRLSDDVLAGARDVADWMVRCQKEDGSWSYAYAEDGSITSPMSDSGTIWNVWSLWRFGKLTGDKKYSDAARNAAAYFKKTFTENHLYRGYWEDVYGGGNTTLNSAQGYESAIAALAFAEIGDIDAMRTSSQDSLRFICTRVLESRDQWTSYGGGSEQQGWAPGTYIAPTLGYAAHLAWRKTGDDILRRFSGSAKCTGWWQDSCG